MVRGGSVGLNHPELISIAIINWNMPKLPTDMRWKVAGVEIDHIYNLLSLSQFTSCLGIFLLPCLHVTSTWLCPL